MEYGSRALEEGNHEVAGGHFYSAWKLNPQDPLVNFIYGMELYRCGNHDEALKRLQFAMDNDVELTGAASQWVRIKLSMSPRDPEALEKLRQLESQHPDNLLLKMIRLELYIVMGDLENSLRIASELEDKNAPEAGIAKAKIHQMRGLRASAENRLDEARQWFEEASSLDENWAGPLINQGVIAERQGHPEKALTYYEKALLVEPDHPVALFDLARLSWRLGDSEKGAVYLERLEQLHPDYPGIGELRKNIEDFN